MSGKNKGFTLIELLLVVMIIGFLLAVIVPRGLRVTTDAKNNIVRQNCAELAAYANDWMEQMILAQDDDSSATVKNYLYTLTTRSFATIGLDHSAWIATSSASNWNETGTNINVPNRKIDASGPPIAPETSIEGIIEPAKMPRNPFNGTSIFQSSNFPNLRTIPGAIGVARADDASTGGNFDYYAFIFLSTDSFGASVVPESIGMKFYGGQSANTLAGLRNGVFFKKVLK